MYKVLDKVIDLKGEKEKRFVEAEKRSKIIIYNVYLEP